MIGHVVVGASARIAVEGGPPPAMGRGGGGGGGGGGIWGGVVRDGAAGDGWGSLREDALRLGSVPGSHGMQRGRWHGAASSRLSGDSSLPTPLTESAPIRAHESEMPTINS